VRYDLAVVSTVRLRDGWNIKLQEVLGVTYVGCKANMESRKVLLTEKRRMGLRLAIENQMMKLGVAAKPGINLRFEIDGFVISPCARL